MTMCLSKQFKEKIICQLSSGIFSQNFTIIGLLCLYFYSIPQSFTFISFDNGVSCRQLPVVMICSMRLTQKGYQPLLMISLYEVRWHCSLVTHHFLLKNWLEANSTTFMWSHCSCVFWPKHIAVILVLCFAK